MRLFWPAVLLLLATLVVLQVGTALGETQTWDEGIHISAGYAYLKYGDYGWNGEHPPLVKIMSALPLVPLKLTLPVAKEPWERRDQVQVGIDFLYRNRIHADAILFRARAMTMLLCAGGGLLLALWTRRRFGPLAAIIALSFYALDPNLIAHGRYVTTDAPMAVFFFLTCAAWTEYLLSGRTRDLLVASVILALALTVKFSAVLLVPVVVFLYAVRWLQRPGEFPFRRLAIVVATIVFACTVVVGVVYWKETVRAFDPDTPELAQAVDRQTWVGEAFHQAGTILDLPRHAFLLGLDSVATHNRSGHSTYLLGKHSEKGWWYYFPIVFAVKSTVAALAAFLLLMVAGILRLAKCVTGDALARMREWPLPWIAMVVPPLFWFAVAMNSGINLGVRHILPVYPPLYIASAAMLANLPWKRGFSQAALSLVALQAAECASIYPHYLAFFNTLSGGPANGPHYLVDSNIDWGQDVKKLDAWLKAHGTRRVWINYFGKADMGYYGLDAINTPPAKEAAQWQQIDGYVAASVTPLQGVYVPYEELAPLRRHPVVAKVGYSIYVYDLRKEK